MNIALGAKTLFKRIQVRNFRILSELQIDRLSVINLIAGRNNSGKTSLLEAIFLLSGAGNPDLAFNTNVVRGMAPGIGVMPPTGESLWKEFFSNLDMSRTIEVTGDHASLGRLTLEIESTRPHTTQIPRGRPSEVLATNLPDEHSLTFRYSSPAKGQIESHIDVRAQAIETTQPLADIPFAATILSSRAGNVQDDAVRLGKLRQQKRGDVLLEALRVVEPSLQSIEDNSASGSPMIWGDVGLTERACFRVMVMVGGRGFRLVTLAEGGAG